VNSHQRDPRVFRQPNHMRHLPLSVWQSPPKYAVMFVTGEALA
jgi:hypothetical protein